MYIKKYFKLFIGCEIHIKCNINKLFTNNLFNINDISNPGVLPKFNYKINKYIFLINFLLNGNYFFLSLIERKLYFYYDLPKNYQLTQNNFQNIFNLLIKNKCNKKIIFKKVHIEEDAASSKNLNYKKIINYKRSGNALFELVTEPLFNEINCLINFIKFLKKIIFNNKISSLNMHLNEMRIDLNLSVINLINFKKSKKIEIKNLNSFENIKKSIKYDYYRQILFLEKKYFLFQQTRSYNKYTYKIRKKCFSKNYNYQIDYDFGYFMGFDYDLVFKKKKKKKIFFYYPKKKYLLSINKKNKYFYKNNFFFLNFFYYFLYKKIKKYKKIFLYKKNKFFFKIKKFFFINF
ncbi:aspartyl/glutamyl-tRNA amidotransferase B subunit [Candidatus Carsonella ruddii HT isolate Thao2000]|uniref:Aspartyl/glutamyl-tRNA amidotransferase B subunit n=1 Tax=Candidatus Carsonella ruddii HT isolate Thao2000 TaxID=1202539 RepID=J3YQ99_CARRU|nr:aspartyl/glutamyl-tRNA amidotransferase B subunit [Candidatus Carsonella ruddii]AFP84088.1 aspartyl/glutamyl-tRNA amidotransferase B subunit [Candidatus Carsonella ruddii HT isolate Thao2000]